MFTQNPMQAFRSVFVALLIISVFPRWCAAEKSKVDASVLKAAQTQSTVSVAIYLQDKPPSGQISEEVKTRFQPNIRAKSTEIRDRIRPFPPAESSASAECQSGGAGDARKPR